MIYLIVYLSNEYNSYGSGSWFSYVCISGGGGGVDDDYVDDGGNGDDGPI